MTTKITTNTDSNHNMIYLLATNNPGKAKEIAPMFEAAGLTLISLADLGLSFEAAEDGTTFLENATQKAKETAAFVRKEVMLRQLNNDPRQFKFPWLARLFLDNLRGKPSPRGLYNFAVLADDSGLEIDALDGAPGVDSALYMGRDTPYPIKNQSIIEKLANTPEENRSARFICQLVCLMPDSTTLTTQGTIEGRIAHTPAGDGGFGYDPIFFHPPTNKTLAQLSKAEKNKLSHRGQAIQKMIGLITNGKPSDTGN